ncbi:uncharacterized protein [Nicotiana tomentosiformis]|uniref:uncharacterized protein n=1 Tax=Nicotiana tomentosiformis TaxID=4098 RepID=UPI00388C7A07
MYQQPNNPPPYPSHGPSSSTNEMRSIENMFKQIMEKDADSDAQLGSHNTSIRNLEVQIGQISQALNSRPKGALPSDTMVNPKGGNNTGHAMAVTTRSRRGGNASTSSQKQLVDDEQVEQEEEVSNNVMQTNNEVRIDIDDNVEEIQEDMNPSRDHIFDIPEPVVQTAKAPLPKPPPPYPQRFAKQNGENQFKKFIQMMKSLSINVSLVEALEKMLGYAKFMKDLVMKKRLMNFETIKVTHQSYRLVFGKACHLPVELEHKAMWALKKLNLDWDVAANLRVVHLNELDEFRYHAYPSSFLYKEKMKYLHDKYIWSKEFNVGDLVLLFNSRLRLFPRKLKFKWSGPFKIVGVTPFGVLDLKNKNTEVFRVNGAIMANNELGNIALGDVDVEDDQMDEFPLEPQANR